MENKSLSSAIKRIAIGYILIYFHINISLIDILPNWLGYFLIVSALPVLSEKEPSAQLLKPFGIALGVWDIIHKILKYADFQWDLTVVTLIFSIIMIYFNFQLITNISNLDIAESKRKRLLTMRSAIVILHTLLSFLLIIPRILDEKIYTYIMMFIGIPQIIMCIWIAVELFGLSNAMKATEGEIYDQRC